MIAKIRFPKYALRFDGVNDYLQNNVSTPFTQWERTQPWTFFAKVKQNVRGGTFFYSGDFSSGSFFRGIAIARTASGQWQIYLRSLVPTNQSSILVFRNDAAIFDGVVQITYDGSSDANGIKLYLNGIDSLLIISQNALAGTLINGLNRYTIGRLVNIAPLYFNGLMEELSFVNYAKSPAEIAADYAAGTQSAGSGSFLLNVKPIYPDFITSLNPAVPFLETAQNTQVDIIGKTNPMLFGTDLVATSNSSSKYYKINLRP